MNDTLRVGIAEYRIAKAPTVLVAYGLGSCLGIILDDRENSIGGMAHTLLPASRPESPEIRQAKYVDTAIQLLVNELLRLGAVRENLTARLVGGANMFASSYTTTTDGIGTRNLRVARATLQTLHIPLQAEDVGGSHGRTVEFDLATGKVLVRSVHGEDIVLAA